MQILNVPSHTREEIIDITGMVAALTRDCGWSNGAVHIYCQHTTCGLTINESADADVQRDLMRFFQEIAPRGRNWLHREGNSDAHIRSSVLGVSLLVPLSGGELCLGTWQHIYLYEGDGPRTRRLLVQHLGG